MASSRHHRLGAVTQAALPEALRAVELYHRHLPKCTGGLAAFRAESQAGGPCGWLIVGRAVARVLDQDGWLEVVRCATIAPKQVHPSIPVSGRHCYGAASALYSAAEAWANGGGQHRPLLTYTLGHESGASLVAAGWLPCGATSKRARQWGCKSRPRKERAAMVAAPKTRWVAPSSVAAAVARGWAVEGLVDAPSTEPSELVSQGR